MGKNETTLMKALDKQTKLIMPCLGGIGNQMVKISKIMKIKQNKWHIVDFWCKVDGDKCEFNEFRIRAIDK